MRKITKAIIAVLCLVLCTSVFFACDDAPKHEHNYTALKSDSTNHWYECPDDGEIKPDSKVAHVDTDNNEKCDVCGYDMHVHTYSEDWKSDNINHWKECTCGARSVESAHVDANNNDVCDICEYSWHVHNYSEDWKSNDTNHWKECSCGSKNEEAVHVDADNNERCDICGYSWHVHNYSEDWKSNDINHWKECACGSKNEETAHVDADLDGKCDVCDHSMNYAIAITDKSVSVLYITKTLTLTITSTPKDAAVTYSSSNQEVATVDDCGVVTALKAGTATITVSFANVSDTIEITVKNTIVNATTNADNFDFSGVYQDDAVVKSNGKQNSFVVFNGDAGKYYIATATAKLTDPAGDDTWSRVGISHYNGTDSYYGLQLSPGPGFNARKTVTMVITNGNVQWGAVTDRSQVWSQHNLSAIDFENVKLTAVRQGNAFYAYINDQLYYADEFVDGFDGDTIPVLNLGSVTAEFSNMSVSYGESAVSEYLATADNSKFYASNDKTIIGADGSIKFIGASDSSCSLNAKDHGAKNIGTQVVLNASVESTVEFDLTIDYVGSRDALPALAVTINRYDSNCNEARSLVIGQYKAGWTGWVVSGDLNAGIGSGGKNYDDGNARLEEGQTYHVVFTRLMYTDGQDTQLKITDKDGKVLLEDAHGWHDGYTGRAVVSFLSRDLDCTISNIVISSANA